MLVFLCAEVTAVAMLINYISGSPLWITATIVITTTLIYTLYGGLRASILTDNFQFLFIIILLLVCMHNIFSSGVFFKSFQLLFFKGMYLSRRFRANSITFLPLIGL